MKTTLLIAFSWLMCFADLCAQSADSELEKKYWNYPNRKRKFFTQIGEHLGEGQVASSISVGGINSDTLKKNKFRKSVRKI